MSAIDTSAAHYHHLDRLPSKRKLDDNDYTVRDDTLSTVGNLLRGESPGQSDGDLQFFVRMFSGKTLVLQANLTDTVEMLHKKIESITGIPVMEQRLIYTGKQLQWEQTLEDCSIQNDAGLQLVGRMRNTYHPRAWWVIDYMVSSICKICRNEMPNSISWLVQGKLESYMTLPLDRQNNNLGLLLYKFDWKKISNKKRKLINDDEGEEDETRRVEIISKFDYCKIFMDARAPQALVMLYMSSDKQNQECAYDCIRKFTSFLKGLEGDSIERTYCATIVMEFCRLLSTPSHPDDLLFLHCRSILGSMLEKIEVVSRPEEVHSSFSEGTTCIAIQDVFPFFSKLALRLGTSLEVNHVSHDVSGPSTRDVCDFSAFLQPVLGFVRSRPTVAAAAIHKSKERVSLSGEVVDELLSLFNKLLSCIGNCLDKMIHCLGIKGKKDRDPCGYWSGWSEYLPILKALSSISVLYPGYEDQFWTMMRQYQVAVRALIVRYANPTDDYSWFLKHKDILDFESRRHLAMLMFPKVEGDYAELKEMLIDRSQLLAESFEYISGAEPSSLHAGLFMEFKDERATGPGVLREWFFLVCRAIFDPQNALFVTGPLDRRRFFPNPASKIDPLHLRYFHFSGRVIALALTHEIQVGMVLDRVFFLQLAERHVSLEDIRDADPCIYKSCKQLLEMDAEFVDSDSLGLTFVTEVEELESRKVVELCSGGKEIAVNSKNRKEYVNLLVQHRFVTAIKEQVSCFARGFSDILRDNKLRPNFFESLEPEDLDWMLHGSESEICIEDWKAHTEYHGFEKSDLQIVWFWEVLEQLNAEQKKTLLFFWTSVKYLPVEGFRGLASRLFIDKSMEPEDHLPSSHTCFYELCIPAYPSKDVMQDRLLVITQEHVGCSFGTW